MLSLIYYILVIAICFVLYLLSWIAFFLTYPFDKRRVVVHFISKLITDTVLGVLGRHVIGVENIDRKQAYVIVINHVSMMDIMSIYPLPLVFKWVSKREVYRIPMVGRLLFMHGDIVINRASTKEAMQLVHTRGKEWLAKEASVAIFPEGTRSKDGEIHNFKLGAFSLAKEAGVDILPVVMTGTTDAFKKGWLVNWRHRVAIRVLEPVSAEAVAATGTKELSQQVHDRMVTALAELRQDVAVEKK